jgi:hypothetical protein
MADRPLYLSAATLNLYDVDSSGNGTGSPLWFGTCAEGLVLSHSVEYVDAKPSGVQYSVKHPINETHSISIERVFIVDGAGYEMDRTKTYVMEVLWTDPNDSSTHKRTYFSVTGSATNVSSDGQSRMNIKQEFEAQFYTEANA